MVDPAPSPVSGSAVVEGLGALGTELLQALTMAVTGKLSLWETLDALGSEVTLTDPDELGRLRDRALDQRERLEQLHAESAKALDHG